jgi:hypothetical protein
VSPEGATRDEAVDKVELLLRDRLSDGVEIVAAEVPARVVENPWVKRPRLGSALLNGTVESNDTEAEIAMSMKAEPHYTLPAAALAEWIESQPDKWWAVDGDPLLTSVVDFPCPSDELVPVIRKEGKDLLVRDKTPGSTAHGESIGADKLTGLADFTKRRHRMFLILAWGDSDDGWVLREDEALVTG